MKVGPLIRRMFGPYERQISEAYRSIFIDLDGLVEQMRQWQPNAIRILEVGCGEGAVTQRLIKAYPGAKITAIDITPHVGRMYEGPREDVQFIRCGVEELNAHEPKKFDLAILCDVLHHVPLELRQRLLDAIRTALAPRGTLIFKDWQRNHALIHWLCYASDRWLTGDHVSYMTRDEMRAGLAHSFGEDALVDEANVGPWRNNIATLVRPRH
jgi:2-polyprenyl-3-methyl-5-hydroxy-6-metoxy-1,4-benzoquinol methylase